MQHLFDVGDGPSFQSAPPEPFVVPRQHRREAKHHHVSEGILLARVRLRLRTPFYIGWTGGGSSTWRPSV